MLKGHLQRSHELLGVITDVMQWCDRAPNQTAWLRRAISEAAQRELIGVRNDTRRDSVRD